MFYKQKALAKLNEEKYIFAQTLTYLDFICYTLRKKSYTRLIKLHDEILNSEESAESIKDRISNRANKLTDLISSSNFKEIKIDFFKSLKDNNEKEVILNPDDAEILSIFIKKILSELKFQ